jgi:sialate O-acetylesterase
MKLRRLTVLFLGALAPLAAKVTVAPLFTDHAVLQQEKPVLVWGTAAPHEHVGLEFHGQMSAADANDQGQWKAELPAFEATGHGADLVIRGENVITLHDVVVGEVWLCSGQSNMEFILWDSKGTVFRVQNGEAEVAAANYPQIRQFKVAKQASATPQITANGNWVSCSPETAAQFTAVGYFFARDLFRRLTVPIGLINSTWGGTPVESWMSQEALASDPSFGTVAKRWEHLVAAYPAAKAAYDAKLVQWQERLKASRAAGADDQTFLSHNPQPGRVIGAPQGDPWQPAGLYNGMISPLLPYRLRGVLWYQGEANAGHMDTALEYHKLFAAMITRWRVQFGQGDVPFYWVQLASFAHSPSWPYLREGQQQTLSLPNTGQAVAIDVGLEDNIHPRNKQEVGRRLALIAANQVYKVPVEFSGPVFANANGEGAAMRVWFNYCANGLKAEQPVATCELAGANHKFYPAEARVDGNSLVVTSAQVPKPVAVRYSWAGFAEGHLYNSAGLPAAPFRSDNW